MFDQKYLTGQSMTADATVSTASGNEHQLKAQRRRVGPDLEIRRLMTGDEEQALCFLGQHPIKNLIMLGLIRDNGLESEANRGTFYGCFLQDQLIGMALMGHCLILSGSSETINHFAHLACLTDVSRVNVMLGEAGVIDSFHLYLRQLTNRLTVERIVPQSLLVLTEMQATNRCAEGLRPASALELDQVARMNAEGYLELNGVDPTTKDPVGFRDRILKRIENGRVWVVKDEAGVAFKVDIVSLTDEAVYLEGILTRSDLRGTGVGSAALRALCRVLLTKHKAVCLFTSADNQAVLSFYKRIGFAPFAAYSLVRFAR